MLSGTVQLTLLHRAVQESSTSYQFGPSNSNKLVITYMPVPCLQHANYLHSKMQCLLHVLTLAFFALQNRTSASAPLPNNQQVYNAYGAYQMLQAAPGQIITLTWPRTADPDGTVADGSSQLNIYYNPNATINAGVFHNAAPATNASDVNSKVSLHGSQISHSWSSCKT